MSKPDTYYQYANPMLVHSVPPTAVCVADVGCGAGSLGRALKELDTGLKVIGLEIDPRVAEMAREHLDEVHVLDIENEDPPIPTGSVDCLIYGDVLEHLRDPWTVLEKHKKLLSTYGSILCSVPNSLHHSVVRELLRGDWQYQDAGLLDSTHLRLFTADSFIKIMMDAGYDPRIVDKFMVYCPDGFMAAVSPFLKYLGVDVRLGRDALSVFQYAFAGTKACVPPVLPEERPLTFVVCVNDEQLLGSNLMASPCMHGTVKHEILTYRGCHSAAEGLNRGIEEASNPIVVCVHQDVYLPKGWPALLEWSLERAGDDFGVVGPIGVSDTDEVSGYVMDRQTPTASVRCWEPRPVQTLDELLLVVRKDTPLRFDPDLGWHLYGADICLSAKKAGLSSFAINAPVFHNSLYGDILPTIFSASANYLARKWASELPVYSTCITLQP